jgi:iron complex outermembrane receptor protein
LNQACGDAGLVLVARALGAPFLPDPTMKSSPVTRRATALPPLPSYLPLALSVALALGASASAAAADQALPTVTVLGARFATDPALAPIGATVITADDIRRAGVTDVNQAIRKIGGVYGRQSLDGSADFALDLRGFGANSGQNLVVMLDGVRLSENDLGGAILATIPVETIERIEILRGGASVLFGEGATGGVIQIVTKRAAQGTRRASLRAEAGQFGLRDLRATMAQAWNGFALDAAVGAVRTDNYRTHNRFDQRTFSGGAQWMWQGGRAGLRIDSARQDADFAGSLTLAQFEADPRQASTLRDFGSFDSDRATAFAEQRLGAFDLAAELSHRTKTAKSTYYVDFGDGNGEQAYPGRYKTHQSQFSPRLRHLSDSAGMLNELVAGVDLARWTRTVGLAPATGSERQNSRAVYLRDEMTWQGAYRTRVAAGLRRESVSKDDVSAFANLDDRQSFTAWELQGSVNPLPQAALTLFAKAGRSFRVPNADENGFRAASAGLRLQASRDLELGATVGSDALGATARAFRHALSDEIFYDPTLNGGFGANTNLDPTERRGVELDAHAALAGALRLVAHLQHVKARFTAGPNDGREMVLVPANIASARLAWVPGGAHSADVGVQWVGSQRYGSDFANDCGARMPSYATVDARYAHRAGPWEFAVAGLNLTDKQHFSQAFSCRAALYPGDGRQLKVSARYDF